ncbi:MAG: hypothetical protein IH866_05545 [Chloroflexi bacterium]|nr:hypothetical protein [Chloroflexota bacterium]
MAAAGVRRADRRRTVALYLAVLVSVSILLAALILSEARSAGATQSGEDLLLVESEVMYDIRPDDGGVHVTWQVDLENNDPETVAPDFGTGLAYESISLPVLRGADDLQATDADGVALIVSVEQASEGPAELATVALGRPLHYGERYSFTLSYELTEARGEGLLVTPAYIFLPALAGGDAATVRITTPDDPAWAVIIEPLACPRTADGAYQCGSSPYIQIAAQVELTRANALTSIESSIALAGRNVTLVISYLTGEEGWAARMQELASRALPVMEALFGHPYDGPVRIEISQRGQQAIAGYGGTFGCQPEQCSIGLSPVADEGIALHEFAHLWTEQYQKRWLSEGLAEFVARRAAEQLNDLNITVERNAPDDPVDLQLDEWEESLFLIGASGEALAVEATGYFESARFFEALESSIGLPSLQTANAAAASQNTGIARRATGIDSEQYLDLLEAASGERLDSLFLERVFAPSYAPILEQRLLVGKQLRAIEPKLEEAGLLLPGAIEQLVGAWRFDEAAQAIEELAAALDRYAAASELVAEPRDAWTEIGLFGKDPDAALSAAAEAFAGADFAAATERADDAASMIDGANRDATLRVIGAGALLAAIFVAIATIFWLLRSRTIVRS